MFYVSLRSRQREVHEIQSYNVKVMNYLGFQKLAIKQDLIEIFKSF
jgi:hypothetical protein